jgi:hypothetical protein
VAEAPNNDLGFRNMALTDPDGNQLRFMEPIHQQAETQVAPEIVR